MCQLRTHKWLVGGVLAFACSFMIVGSANANANAPAATDVTSVCATTIPGHASCDAQVVVGEKDKPLHFRPHAVKTAPSDTNIKNGVLVAGSASVKTANEPAAAAEPAATTPAYLQQAYDLTELSANSGAGDVVAIVDAYNDPSAESDLATYRAEFGLPACTTANGCFRKVNQEGGSSYPSADTGWDLEISLDEDAVSAFCPLCHILLVEANSDSASDLALAQTQADALGAQQISDSWGLMQATPLTGTFTFPGVATVAASGDSGYLGPNEDQFPAALADVTAAGGTTLLSSSSTRGFVESAWDGTGSGCATDVVKPAWQDDSGCAGRSYNDLSADGDPNTGLLVYDTGYGGWVQVGGTSLSSPLVAAYYALVGAQANAATSAWAYAHAGSLNDIISGANGTCLSAISYICKAGVGYDGPTGVGSISGAVAVGAPGIAGPSSTAGYVVSTTATSATLSSGLYPNGLSSSYHWEYGPNSSYGLESADGSVDASADLSTTTSELTNLSPDTTYHYREVANNADGSVYGYDFSFTTASATPSISNDAAINITDNSAVLTGVVDAAGATGVSYHFVYGPTSAYGETSSVSAIGGDAPTDVSAVITGLAPASTYHFTLVVTSGGESVSYFDQTLTTAPAPTTTTTTAPATKTTTPTTGATTKPAPTSAATSKKETSSGATIVVKSVYGVGKRLLVLVKCEGKTGSECTLRLQLRSRTRLIAQGKRFVLAGGKTMTVSLSLVKIESSQRLTLLVQLLEGSHYKTVGLRDLSVEVG